VKSESEFTGMKGIEGIKGKYLIYKILNLILNLKAKTNRQDLQD